MNRNIYSKLMSARVKFHKLKLKKTGHNKFAGFKYYELADFLVPATQLLQEENLCPIVTFTNEEARLTLVNGDNPEEQIIFTSPMRDLELKGTNAIQNLGGSQTYLTRYLYIQLMNIVEADVFDATSGQNIDSKVSRSVPKSLSDKQLTRLYTIASKAGYSSELLKEMVLRKYSKEPKDLTKQEYDYICDTLEKGGK